jgi:7-cyano-7-deazaguanine synthase
MVTLVSGGLDSTLLAILAKEEGVEQYPLFINYGQICKEKELKSCIAIHRKYKLPKPRIMNVSGFGRLISSGLTNRKMRRNEDAFLPGRNLLFLLAASSYAYQNKCQAVGIGLLSDEQHLFPDQTKQFVETTQNLIRLTLGRDMTILAPLMNFTKKDIIAMAKERGIKGTYSCHAGTKRPCGTCVSCMEKLNAM